MDFTSIWILEACDFFRDYIASESDYIMLKKFIEYLEFPGVYELKYLPASAMNLVLLKGDEDETYSSEELSFLENATRITLLSDIIDNTELNFFQVELNCSEEIKDSVACVLIKILNKSFKTKNVFIFKCLKTIAIGSKFIGGEKAFDNFCISKWYSQEDNMEEILELSYEYCNVNNIDLTLINFSNEVMRQSHLVTEKNYDYHYIDLDYERALIDIQASYRIDLTKEIQKYNNRENDEDLVICTNNYRLISDEFRSITPEDLSSYDYLELAQKAEEKANKEVNNSDNHTERLLLNELKDFDEDAFLSAEKMLEYVDGGE